ncbi:unnamed protein product [Euphydryas editha]|uniref:C2H2-type domain-containing protein n=1 Tax=Euphydryas editha TaxID=104508 RepID=A0AAU9TBH6_EUPED|nr:unnamed protein product [Euphydryas editha]
MADDIDIEEHDVLDNPRIKNIFPDITSIKTEVNDYEDEDINESLEENYETYQQDTDIPDYLEDIPNLYQNKIILGSKPCESTSSEDEEPEIMESSVVLEDWGDLLRNNPCFCCDCQILFPTENALDSHKMTAHSFLVAVGRNKAIKSTSKSSIVARLKFESDSNMDIENLCNHCNKTFPDEISFLEHTYELLPRKCDICDSVFESETALKHHLDTHASDFVFCCPVCSCHFKYTNKLITHVSYQHHINLKSIPESVKTFYKCAFCPAQLKSNKTYNGHIYYRHTRLYNKIVNEKTDKDKFKCQPCNLTFPSAYSEKIHRVSQHMAKSEKFGKSVDLEKQIKIEPLSPKAARNALKQEFIIRPVPKSTLFKCNKCQTHFVSSLSAIEHIRRCVLKKRNWKCKKCRRSFRLVDRRLHMIQHEWTDQFKVINVQENMFNKILCRCVSCKMCADERTLVKYHQKGCSKTTSFLCNICNINIYEYAIAKHTKIHSELGSESFVIVDYANLDQSTNRIKFYYYCPTCRCYMKVNKLPDKHHIGKCRRDLLKCLCKLCGLTFSSKGFVTHTKDHKKFPNLKLKNLTFRSTQSGKKVNPPPPNFTKCVNCEVKFFSTVALKSHVCNIVEAKTCGYCGDKFSDLAYKLHVSFHEYARDTMKAIEDRPEFRENSESKNKVFENIPELIKKYESLKIIWNILFLCEMCDTIFDDYDEVVEHSQDHFCNMESYNVTINQCTTCNLKFVGKSYEKHMNLHLAKTVTKSSFKILPFMYDTLLTDSWYDIFKTLAKDQMDQILNKSKYKHTRCVRMHTFVDGLIDLTLYQCSVCGNIVDWNLVEEHAKNSNNCSDSIKLNCHVCDLSFATKKSLMSHEYLHEKRPARIVLFNKEDDFYFNNVLRSKMNTESLKFIRCQHCGKLINKAKYKKHVEHHKYYVRTKNITNKKTVKKQPKFLIRPKFVKIDNKVVHKFYKCSKCSVCVFKNNIPKHFCSLKSQKRQCPKCHLWFRSSHLTKHFMYHDKYKLTKKDVNVYTFKNGKIERERRDKVVLYQCLDCAVCLHRETNIKRHICLRSSYQKMCDLCEMPFHCSRIQLHQRLHEDKTFSKKDIVIKKFKSLKVLEDTENEIINSSVTRKNPDIFKKTKAITAYTPSDELRSKEFLRFVNLRFYKCKCKLLFITSQSLLEHAVTCANDRIGVTCDKCGLVFHKSVIDLHKNINKCPVASTNIYIVTLENDALTYDNTKCIYNCYKCNINYITFRALLHHIELNHVVKLKLGNCNLCNVMFSARSFVKHELIHHKHRNLSLADLNRFTVERMTLTNALNDLPDINEVNIEMYEKSNQSIDEKKSLKRKLDEENVVSKQIKLVSCPENLTDNSNQYTYDLYPCKTCNLHFLSKKTLKRHLLGRHNEKKIFCRKCGLEFTQNSLTRHLRAHHENRYYTTYKLNYSAYMENNDSSEIKEGPSVIEEASGVEERAPNVQQQQQQQINNRTTNKLYRCSKCDVYYLLSDACRDHVANHTTLDPTEYIACKICDLQFLCEYLGSHMKGHREKTFNIDEIIVEEYQFKDGDIKVDSYPAVERLKSKLVTTTTHFDTEDEKNDDSTVESTVSLNDTSDGFNNIVSNVNEGTDVEMKSTNCDS